MGFKSGLVGGHFWRMQTLEAWFAFHWSMHHRYGSLVCGVVVLLQDPRGDTMASEDYPTLREECLLHNTCIFIWCNVPSLLTLLITVGCLMLAGACHNVEISQPIFGYPTINVDNLGMVHCAGFSLAPLQISGNGVNLEAKVQTTSFWPASPAKK